MSPLNRTRLRRPRCGRREAYVGCTTALDLSVIGSENWFSGHGNCSEWMHVSVFIARVNATYNA